MYLLLVILSSFCHAIVDALMNHYNESIFLKKNPNFWNPSVSSMRAIKFLAFRLDAVTVFGWLTLLFLILTGVFCQLPAFRIPLTIAPIYVQTLVAIVLYITAYNIFLKKVLLSKKDKEDEKK